MKSLRKMLKWLLVILLAGGIAGGFYVYRFLAKFDQELQSRVQAKLAELAPEWDLAVGRCRFDFFSRLYIDDLTLHLDGQAEPLTTVPEVVVTVDRSALADDQQVVIQKVRLVKPRLRLSRSAEGSWNWQGLPPLPHSTRSLPECEIQQGTVIVDIDHGPGLPPARFTLRHVDLQLIPSGKRRFSMKGVARIDRIGELWIDGDWDVDHRTVQLDGGVKELPVGQPLVALVSHLAPPVGEKLAQIHAGLAERMRQAPDPRSTSPFALASQSAVVVFPDGPEARLPGDVPVNMTIPDLGVTAVVNVDFRVGLGGSHEGADYKLLVRILRGRIANPVLPFPLDDLTGEIYTDGASLQITDFRATNGATRLSMDGSFARKAGGWPGGIAIEVTDLPCDERLRSRLTEEFQRVYDMHRPSGSVDIEAVLVRDEFDQWRPIELEVRPQQCSILHDKFPYPIEAITGLIAQRPATERKPGEDAATILDVDVQGRAGRRIVSLKGWIRNPGPAAESLLVVSVNSLPLDETFLAACRPYPPVLKSLMALDLRGEADLQAQLYRPAGLGEKFQVRMIAYVKNGALKYKNFPYQIDRLSGTIIGDRGQWTFRDLEGFHGMAHVSAQGTFGKIAGVPQLNLELTAEGAPINEPLKRAMPAGLRKVWDEFSPTGTLNLTSRIQWAPESGEPASIALPEVELVDGGMVMEAFPYPVDSIQAKFSYFPAGRAGAGSGADLLSSHSLDRDADRDDILLIRSFTGRHNGAALSAKGIVRLPPNKDWKIHLAEVSASNLEPDETFRQALPAGLREVVECLDPDQRVSVSGMVEFWGTANPHMPVTAAWDLKTIFSGGGMTTGLEYDNVHGSIAAQGTWDGEQASIKGRIDLKEATVLGYRLTEIQGPFRVNGAELIVGSKEALDAVRKRGTPQPIDDDQRVRAHAIDGVITLDGRVELDQGPRYHIKLGMSHGQLERYAQLYMPGTTNLQGTMNGWIDLYGRGESSDSIVGRGQLQINPAALYELPIIVQIFNALTFVPPDKTAFNYALLDFNISRSQFVFNSIDLVGNAISLRGHGTAGFNGRLHLDFYSMLPRTQLPPPLNVFVSDVTKGWVGVAVRGTISSPKAVIQPLRNVDEALRRFLQAFELRAPAPGILPLRAN